MRSRSRQIAQAKITRDVHGCITALALTVALLTTQAARSEESGLEVQTVSAVDINGVEMISGIPSFAALSVSIGPLERPMNHVVSPNPVGYMYRVDSGSYLGRIEYGPSTDSYSDHVGFVRNGFNIAAGFGDDFRGVDTTLPSNASSILNPDGTRSLICSPNNPPLDATDCNSWGFRVAGRSFSFRSLDRVGTFTEVSPQGQSVVKSAGRWVFTTGDGTQIRVLAVDTERNFEFPKGNLESILYPSGLEVKIHYREGRISVVSRNDGFALKYFYESVLGRTGVPENYVRPNRIVAFNSTVDYCNPAAATCSFSRTWPEAAFSWTHQGAWNSAYTTQFTITAAGGAATRYTLDKYGRVTAFRPGSSSVNTMTYVYCQNNRQWNYPVGHAERLRNCPQGTTGIVGSIPVQQDQVLTLDKGGGLLWNYQRMDNYVSEASFAESAAWSNGPEYDGTIMQAGSVYRRSSHPSTLRLSSVSSPNGNSASFDWTNEVNRQTSFAAPDQGTYSYTYDSRGNVTRVVHAGTGMTSVERIANYDSTCSSRVACNKPNWTTAWATDANGPRTDYDYDTTHGGALSVTGPAVGGVRPQIRYVYQQRSPSGAYVDGSTPSIWMVLQESFCRTGAASGAGCAISGDEVVTSYEYSTNNLLLRGKVVTADGQALRTCYANDDRGNKVGETTPNAALTVCP